MAIQIPNPGTGNGATGDNEFVLWTKTKDNFSDATHAASKLVGDSVAQVPTGAHIGSSYARNWFSGSFSGTDSDSIKLPIGTVYVYSPNYPLLSASLPLDRPVVSTFTMAGSSLLQFCYPQATDSQKNIFFRVLPNNSSTREWLKLYHTGNTLKDSNGFVKASSPTVKVFADKVEMNGEAADQDVSYKKNGIGDYTITTVSGLSTDGWYIELPKDMNGNPKVAVTLSEVDGVISLKSYKRIFSMETFTFEPDLDSPLDIPDTRWIDLRLNEIPVEIEDETQMEV